MLFDDKFRSSKSLVSKSEQNKNYVTAVWNYVQVYICFKIFIFLQRKFCQSAMHVVNAY